MVTLNRIYTRTGDDGSTGLVGGARIRKNDPRVDAYGDVDELNCHIGICVTIANNSTEAHIRDRLVLIQNELFDLGSELATPFGAGWEGMPKTEASHVNRLESWIDELNGPLSDLKSFVLPGGTALNGQLHLARAVCRRAERAIISLNDIEQVSGHVIQYVNRLSDLLFVMSRAAAQAVGAQEFLWVPGGSRPQPRDGATKAS